MQGAVALAEVPAMEAPEAADIMLVLLGGSRSTRRVRLTGELVVRESTRPAPR